MYLEDFKLFVTFDGGQQVVYDVNEDIEQIPDFSVLRTEPGLFSSKKYPLIGDK